MLLQTAMLGVQGSGMSFVLPLILMGLTILIVLLSEVEQHCSMPWFL